jgi:hypothetical protein
VRSGSSRPSGHAHPPRPPLVAAPPDDEGGDDDGEAQDLLGVDDPVDGAREALVRRPAGDVEALVDLLDSRAAGLPRGTSRTTMCLRDDR